MSNVPILFLDFDGVLHPDPDPDQWPERGPCFTCLPVLEEALRGLDCHIVITSGWRGLYPLSDLIAQLGELGPRVGDITSFLSHLPPKWNKGRAVRQAEVLRWLEINGQQNTPFLVLDDWADGFEPAWPALYLADGKTGLRPEDCKPIRVRLSRLQRGEA